MPVTVFAALAGDDERRRDAAAKQVRVRSPDRDVVNRPLLSRPTPISHRRRNSLCHSADDLAPRGSPFLPAAFVRVD